MLAALRAFRMIAGLLCLLGMLLAGCASGPVTNPLTAVASSRTGCPPPSPNAPGAAESHLPVRSLCALPPEVTTLYREIQNGGPFDYPKDGSVFENAEGRLPERARGYYHEYTVPTPGAHTRGARRLVTGGDNELYYTGNHYATFVVVDPRAGADERGSGGLRNRQAIPDPTGRHR